MGKGMAYDDLPFLGIGCPVSHVANIYLQYTSNVWATVSIIAHLSWMIQPTGFHFEKRIGLVTMDLLYTIFTW